MKKLLLTPSNRSLVAFLLSICLAMTGLAAMKPKSLQSTNQIALLPKKIVATAKQAAELMRDFIEELRSINYRAATGFEFEIPFLSQTISVQWGFGGAGNYLLPAPQLTMGLVPTTEGLHDVVDNILTNGLSMSAGMSSVRELVKTFGPEIVIEGVGALVPQKAVEYAKDFTFIKWFLEGDFNLEKLLSLKLFVLWNNVTQGLISAADAKIEVVRLFITFFIWSNQQGLTLKVENLLEKVLPETIIQNGQMSYITSAYKAVKKAFASDKQDALDEVLTIYTKCFGSDESNADIAQKFSYEVFSNLPDVKEAVLNNLELSDEGKNIVTNAKQFPCVVKVKAKNGNFLVLGINKEVQTSTSIEAMILSGVRILKKWILMRQEYFKNNSQEMEKYYKEQHAKTIEANRVYRFYKMSPAHKERLETNLNNASQSASYDVLVDQLQQLQQQRIYALDEKEAVSKKLQQLKQKIESSSFLKRYFYPEQGVLKAEKELKKITTEIMTLEKEIETFVQLHPYLQVNKEEVVDVEALKNQISDLQHIAKELKRSGDLVPETIEKQIAELKNKIRRASRQQEVSFVDDRVTLRGKEADVYFAEAKKVSEELVELEKQVLQNADNFGKKRFAYVIRPLWITYIEFLNKKGKAIIEENKKVRMLQKYKAGELKLNDATVAALEVEVGPLLLVGQGGLDGVLGNIRSKLAYILQLEDVKEFLKDVRSNTELRKQCNEEIKHIVDKTWFLKGLNDSMIGQIVEKLFPEIGWLLSDKTGTNAVGTDVKKVSQPSVMPDLKSLIAGLMQELNAQ